MADDKAEPLRPDSPSSEPEMVNVTAPADLPAGYRFEAQVKDSNQLVKVVVPDGGVKEGDVISVPSQGEPPRSSPHHRPRLRAPKGHWKDGLFGCFNYGCCHPSLCWAIWCPYILMAQVMTRMRLTWTGEHSRARSTKKTYRHVFRLVMFYVALMVILTFVEAFVLKLNYVPASVRRNLRIYIPVIKTVACIFFSLWGMYSLCMTRENVRIRYSIRQKPYFCGCEDLWCSVCCTCCTVAQLARHTGDYETYPAACCKPGGHAADSKVDGPLMV